MYDYGYLNETAIDALIRETTTSAANVDSITSTVGQILGIISTISTIATLAIVIVSLIGLWKIFTKAGQPGWKSLIPIYNTITLLKIAGLSPWLILVYFANLIPVVGAFIVFGFTIYYMYKLSTAFGHGIGYTIGLLFLTPIFYCMLGFGKSEYQGAVEQ